MLFVATPHRAYRGPADPRGQDRLRRLELRSRARPGEGPRHRLGRFHRRVPRRRSCSTQGHEVVGVDNYSKYGPVEKSYQRHPRLHLRRGRRAATPGCWRSSRAACDHFVAGAARIGGISYFHEYAYDLLAENERIIAASFDAGLAGVPQGAARQDHGALEQHGLRERHRLPDAGRAPARVSRRRRAPTGFRSSRASTSREARANSTDCPTRSAARSTASGVGESRALGGRKIPSGNVELAMSHVVPDLVQKVLKGQDPLRILGSGDQIRCYTYGGDLARGIAAAIFHPAARNEDFNLSTPVPDDRAGAREGDLGEGPRDRPRRETVPLRERSALPPRRRPARPGHEQGEAGSRFRGDRRALDAMLDEVVPWIRREIAEGRI